MSGVLSTPTVGLGGLAQLRAADAKEEQRSLTFSYFNSFSYKYEDKYTNTNTKTNQIQTQPITNTSKTNSIS